MTEEKRDLAYYMDHPEEMPEDPSGLLAEAEGGEESTETIAAALAAKEKSDAAKPAATDDAKTEVVEDPAKKGAEETPQVVKSKDGKHEIPYSVLQSERDSRKAADAVVAQLREQLAALEAGKQAQPKEEAEPDPTQAELDQIAEEFPAAGKLLKALSTQIGALQKEVATVRASDAQRGAKEQETASTTVQQAIDANPTLSYWQSKDQEAFAFAVQLDNQIKADKRNSGLSLDERFAKVVKAYEAVHGETELPEEFKPKKAPPATPAKDMKANAEKAIADANKKTPTVASLSDIPGGTPPEVDELEQMGQLTANELGNKFLKMTAEQQNAILARLV